MATTFNNEVRPTEIAFHIPGKGWKRREFRTEYAARRFVERLIETEGDDVEVRWRADGGAR